MEKKWFLDSKMLGFEISINQVNSLPPNYNESMIIMYKHTTEFSKNIFQKFVGGKNLVQIRVIYKDIYTIYYYIIYFQV